MSKKTAVIFNANDPQMPQAHLFVESLRDPLRGNYDGDVWIVSTHLSTDAKKYIKKMNFQYIEDPMDFLWDWPGRHVAAEYTRSTKPKQLLKSFKEKAKLMEEEINRIREETNRAREEANRAREEAIRAQGNIKIIEEKVISMFEIVQDLEEKVRNAEKENVHAQEEALKGYFYEFRNKRLSKLLVLKFLELHGAKYEKIIVCDTDILVQSPVKEVFDQVVDDRLYYWIEENQILPGTYLWHKNLGYKKLMTDKSQHINFGRHEINIGFLAGRPHFVQKVWSIQKELMLAEEHIKLITYGWHEQDYFRLLRGLHPDWFALFREGTVVQLCNGGGMLIKEERPLEFKFVTSNNKPIIVHFAGGTWSPFDSINKTYRLKAEDFFSYYVNT